MPVRTAAWQNGCRGMHGLAPLILCCASPETTSGIWQAWRPCAVRSLVDGCSSMAGGSGRRDPAQRPPSCLRDPYPRALDLLTAGDHAFGLGGREPGTDELDQHLDRKSVREHQRLGAAVRGSGEQFEGAATVGLRAAMTAVRV